MHRWKLAGVSEAIRTQRTLAVLAHRRHHRLHAAQRENVRKKVEGLPPDGRPAAGRCCGPAMREDTVHTVASRPAVHQGTSYAGGIRETRSFAAASASSA